MLRIELSGVCSRSVVGSRLSGYFGGLTLEGSLNHCVQILDPISQLEVDLLQALHIVINDSLLMQLVLVNLPATIIVRLLLHLVAILHDQTL